MGDPLQQLAERVGDDPYFLASTLRCYAEIHALDDEALAMRLDCSAKTLTQLRLCRAPQSQPPGFWDDIETIANRYELDADTLADMVREGQVVLRLRPAATDTQSDVPGSLMAARDREDEPKDETP